MRATFRNLLETKRREREERTGDAGFSLIELIVVVVIIGILVAIAIPIFLGVEHAARMGAVKAAATDGATAVSGVVAEKGANITAGDISPVTTANSKGDITVVMGTPAVPKTVDTVCVKASDPSSADLVYYAGQGALADGSGCTN